MNVGPKNQNLLLESLPEETRARLKKLLEPVGMPKRADVYRPGHTPRYAYFLTSGMASIVLSTSEGLGMEIGIVGHEGTTAWLHLLGKLPVTSHGFMQIEGTGLRMPMSDLRREYEADAALRQAIDAYAQHQTLVAQQLIVCNRKHSVEQRLARWLLMVQDRVGTLDLPLTQEFLAEMLGSRRTSVGVAIGELERRKLLVSHRGHVSIADDAGLRKASCECYGVLRGLLEAL